jgi:hypothetical protein
MLLMGQKDGADGCGLIDGNLKIDHRFKSGRLAIDGPDIFAQRGGLAHPRTESSGRFRNPSTSLRSAWIEMAGRMVRSLKLESFRVDLDRNHPFVPSDTEES